MNALSTYSEAIDILHQSSEYTIEQDRHWKTRPYFPGGDTPTLLESSAENRLHLATEGIFFLSLSIIIILRCCLGLETIPDRAAGTNRILQSTIQSLDEVCLFSSIPVLTLCSLS